ncbi:hypothetical protein CLV44_12123 [Marinobacterium halophilum]|uniref:Uncharacterized protein n=1 Tax=Marinobacterium halophilum TaxID=267374 RepID=A0A2P8ER45_9GAMM|nr:hypothetical protein CLV44_12123 [Marinobacterium halophilum]
MRIVMLFDLPAVDVVLATPGGSQALARLLERNPPG